VSLDGGKTWDDIDAKALTIPGPVFKLYELAADTGWRVSLSFAPGPPANVALRARRGTIRAYGSWNLTDGTKWNRGAANLAPGGGVFLTVTAFKAFLVEYGDLQIMQAA
jgi:hypothetical protein